MPPVATYSVNFANGNLHPHWNPNGWGDMQTGETNATDYPERWGDSEGLNLRVGRIATSKNPATNTVYLIPPAGGIPLNSRLMLKVEFDQPLGESWVTSPSNNPAGTVPLFPEPWAVALNVKSSGNQNDLSTDRFVGVTCQFNRLDNGVKLNVPGSLQNDPSAVVDSPLDYSKYQSQFAPRGPFGFIPFPGWPPVFVLEHTFCGHGAAVPPPATPKDVANGHVPGSGWLTIKEGWFAAGRADQRVYSSSRVSGSGDTTVTAVGIALVTGSGVGRISVRLRSFTLSINHPAVRT